MIKKSADSLVAWDAKGNYNYLSRVWYQRSPDRAGYAYKLDTSYPYDNGNPPDNNRKWVIDYTYAAPWSEFGKYIIGARVYYFNGRTSYVYVASKRYFGGTGKPNEEVDADGIRTWEIELEYSKDPDVFPAIATPPHSQFVWPTRHFGGFTNGKLFPWDCINPEEYETLYLSAQADELGEGGGAEKFIKAVSGKSSNDYSGINSIYQSYPYDENTYQFYLKELDANGNKVHRGRGIHWGNVVRDESDSTDVKDHSKTADRQYTYCVWGPLGGVGGIYGYGYFQKYGFAIEMWPSLEDSDFSLVPSIGLNDYWKPWNPYEKTPLNPWPEIYTAVDMNGYGITSGGGGVINFNGLIQDPNGYPEYATETPDEQLKRFAYFERSSPFFSERTSQMYLVVSQTETSYEKYPIYDYEYDENGNVINKFISSYGYTPRTEKPSYLMYYELTSSYDRDYKETNINLDFYTRTITNPRLVDFSKFKKKLCNTQITSVGWKVI